MANANGGFIGIVNQPTSTLTTQFTAPGTFIPKLTTANVLVVAGGGGSMSERRPEGIDVQGGGLGVGSPVWGGHPLRELLVKGRS
jgi:hypothetical protein